MEPHRQSILHKLEKAKREMFGRIGCDGMQNPAELFSDPAEFQHSKRAKKGGSPPLLPLSPCMFAGERSAVGSIPDFGTSANICRKSECRHVAWPTIHSVFSFELFIASPMKASEP